MCYFRLFSSLRLGLPSKTLIPSIRRSVTRRRDSVCVCGGGGSHRLSFRLGYIRYLIGNEMSVTRYTYTQL